jgi:hypothetical protein
VNVRYWARAGLALGRSPRRRDLLKDLARRSIADAAAPRATSMHFLDAYTDAQSVTIPMGDVVYKLWNMDPLERFCVGALAQLLRPESIFEIGTFDGATTLLLARSAPDARVFTLDFPPEEYRTAHEVGWSTPPTDFSDPHEEIGFKFRGTPEGERITQLLGDSRTFDFSDYHGQVQLVVVDGGHEYDCARSDSENALRMAGANGVVVWDDYHPTWPGVIRAVDEISARERRTIVQLRSTELAVLDPALESRMRDT